MKINRRDFFSKSKFLGLFPFFPVNTSSYISANNSPPQKNPDAPLIMAIGVGNGGCSVIAKMTRSFHPGNLLGLYGNTQSTRQGMTFNRCYVGPSLSKKRTIMGLLLQRLCIGKGNQFGHFFQELTLSL